MEVLQTYDRLVSSLLVDVKHALAESRNAPSPISVPQSPQTPSSSPNVKLVVWQGTAEAYAVWDTEEQTLHPSTQTSIAVSSAQLVGFRKLSVYTLSPDGSPGELLWHTEYFGWGLPALAGIPFEVLKGYDKFYVEAEGYDSAGNKYLFSGAVEAEKLVLLAGEKQYSISFSGQVQSADLPLSNETEMQSVLKQARLALEGGQNAYGVKLSGTLRWILAGEKSGEFWQTDIAEESDWIAEADVSVVRSVRADWSFDGQNLTFVVGQTSLADADVVEQTKFGGLDVYLTYDNNILTYRASMYHFYGAKLHVRFWSDWMNDSGEADLDTESAVEVKKEIADVYKAFMQATGKKNLMQYGEAVLLGPNKEELTQKVQMAPSYSKAELIQKKLVYVSVTEASSDYLPLKLYVKPYVEQTQYSFSKAGLVSASTDWKFVASFDKQLSALAHYLPTDYVVTAGQGSTETELLTNSTKPSCSAYKFVVAEDLYTADGERIFSNYVDGDKLYTLARISRRGVLFCSCYAVLHKSDVTAVSVPADVDDAEKTDDSGKKILVVGLNSKRSFELFDEKGQKLYKVLGNADTELAPPPYSASLEVDTDKKELVLSISAKQNLLFPPAETAELVLVLNCAEDGSKQTEVRGKLNVERRTETFGDPAKQIVVYGTGSGSAESSISAKKVSAKVVFAGGGSREEAPVRVVSDGVYFKPQQDGTALANYSYSLQKVKDYVVVKVSGPILNGKVVLKSDTGKKLEAQYQFALNKAFKLCEVTGGEEYSELTVVLPLFCDTIVKTYEVPKPRAELKNNVLYAEEFGWACRIEGQMKYKTLPVWPELKAEQKADSVVLKQPDTPDRPYPAYPLSSFLSAVPDGEVEVELQTSGQKWKVDAEVEWSGEWPNVVWIHPLVGKYMKLGCMKGGKVVDCTKADFSTTGYALFYWKQKYYAYKIGTPDFHVQFMSAQDSGSVGVLSISMVPLFLSPVTVQYRFYKPVAQVTVQTDTANSKYSRDISLLDIYKVEVEVRNRWGYTVYKQTFLNWGFAYGRIQLKEGGSAEAQAVVVHRGPITAYVKALQGNLSMVVYSMSATDLLEMDADVPVPEGADSLELDAEVDGTVHKLYEVQVSRGAKILQALKEYVPFIGAFLLAGGVAYGLTTLLFRKRK